MTINQHSRVWEGVFGSFAEVDSEPDVFEGSIWREKLLQRAIPNLHQFKSEGSVPIVTTDDMLPMLAAMVSPADRQLRILDFGGGLGASYFPVRAVLPNGQGLDFVIVETRAVCELGKSLFRDDISVSFLSTIPTQVFDIVHAASSLHYVEDWRGTLRQFAETKAEYLVFVDVPAGKIDTFVTAQLFHGHKIPVHFWNATEFSEAVETLGFVLVFEAPYQGAYLEPHASLPTGHFDARYRLSHCVQMVFRRKPG